MNAERQAAARDVLQSERAKQVFDQLCAIYPDASVFWSAEDGVAELGINSQPLKNGVSVAEVTVLIT